MNQPAFYWDATDCRGDGYEGDAAGTLIEAVAAATAEVFLTDEVDHVDVYAGGDHLHGRKVATITRNPAFAWGGRNGPAVFVEDHSQPVPEAL